MSKHPVFDNKTARRKVTIAKTVFVVLAIPLLVSGAFAIDALGEDSQKVAKTHSSSDSKVQNMSNDKLSKEAETTEHNNEPQQEATQEQPAPSQATTAPSSPTTTVTPQQAPQETREQTIDRVLSTLAPTSTAVQNTRRHCLILAIPFFEQNLSPQGANFEDFVRAAVVSRPGGVAHLPFYRENGCHEYFLEQLKISE